MVEAETERKRFEKIKNVLNNPATLAIIIILSCALLLRIYYFNETRAQPLWWDEAEYLSTSKHWAFNVPYDVNPQRPPLYQAIAAAFFSFGLGELTIKFFLTLLPSVLLVYAVYLLGKEMYNKKAGIIAAIFTAVSWTLLFWTARAQPDFFSMSFQVLSVFFMWKYWKTETNKFAVYAGIFTALGFYFKVSALLIPMSFMIFIAIKDRLAGFKMKGHWYYAAAFLITLIPYFIWAQATFGDPLAFRTGYSKVLNPETRAPLAWNTIPFFYLLTENLLFVLFIAGTIMALKFMLFLDILKKEKKKCFDPDIFAIIVLIVVLAFYIFYIRGVEDRWVFLWLPFIFFLAAKPLNLIYNKLAGKKMFVAMAIVLLLVGFCAYKQVQHASSLIENKKDSYAQVREAALWMKENSNKNDLIFSMSYTQTVYYAERNVTYYASVKNSSEMDSLVKEYNPSFIEWSVFEQHPQWVFDWMNTHLQKRDINVVYAKFSDEQQQQPILIVFTVNYTSFAGNVSTNATQIA
jgi:hypothetical protein